MAFLRPNRGLRVPDWWAHDTSSLSILDPIHLGQDEYGLPVSAGMAYRNLLGGGEPGGGKSNALQLITGHAALCSDVDRLVFLDGKKLELGFWRPVADEFVGPDLDRANAVLAALQGEIDTITDELEAAGLRKISTGTGRGFTLVVVDELALYTSVYGSSAQQKEFGTRLRDILARGRATGHIVVAATQRPSADIVPSSLRDLFAYRWAFRTTSNDASDIILGQSWASQGFTATDIEPDDACRGIGYVLAEGGIPRRFKAAYLTDDEIRVLVNAARRVRAARPPRPLLGGERAA